MRENRVDWVRTILHQVPYYIPPVIIANIINIGIFAFMMGFIEIFPNLLALVFGTSKNMSLILNTTAETAAAETSGDTVVPVSSAGDADPDLTLPELDELSGLGADTEPPTSSDTYFDAFDVTLAYTVFMSSIVVAGMGQILMHLEQHGQESGYSFCKYLIIFIIFRMESSN